MPSDFHNWKQASTFSSRSSSQRTVAVSRVVSGQWSVVSGQWSVASGQWPVASGQWSVASGQWPVVSGQWPVVSGPLHYPHEPPLNIASRDALIWTHTCSRDAFPKPNEGARRFTRRLCAEALPLI